MSFDPKQVILEQEFLTIRGENDDTSATMSQPLPAIMMTAPHTFDHGQSKHGYRKDVKLLAGKCIPMSRNSSTSNWTSQILHDAQRSIRLDRSSSKSRRAKY